MSYCTLTEIEGSAYILKWTHPPCTCYCLSGHEKVSLQGLLDKLLVQCNNCWKLQLWSKNGSKGGKNFIWHNGK